MPEKKEFPVLAEGTETAQIVYHEDTNTFHLLDMSDNSVSDPLVMTKDGLWFALPANSSNRKWASVNKVKAEIEKNGFVTLAYKATKHIGSIAAGTRTKRYPGERLFAFLSDDEVAEVKAIIDKAYEAQAAERAANKAPATDIDKLKAKLERLQKQLQEAEAALGTDESAAE